MPVLIKQIDEIGREKQRDVLSITFNPPATDEDCWDTDFDWRHDQMRMQVLSWLDEHQIDYQPCAEFCGEECVAPYLGRIYVDVPFDETDKQYKLLKNYLEHEDGTMRYDTVGFWVLPLANAMAKCNDNEEAYCKDST